MVLEYMKTVWHFHRHGVAEYDVSKFLILPIFGQNFFPLLSNKQKLFIKLLFPLLLN
jgi:hypothetical protein